MKSFYARTRYVRNRRLRSEQLYRRVIAYLAAAESRARTIDEREHYDFCRKVVNFAFRDASDPCKVIAHWLERQPQKHERMVEIPDYDPTLQIRVTASHAAVSLRGPTSLPSFSWRLGTSLGISVRSGNRRDRLV
jgi:hypothetical protein